MRDSALRRLCLLCVTLCAAITVGCGGNSSQAGSALPPQWRNTVSLARSAAAVTGNVTFSIGIKPKKKTGRIAPEYVSPSTQSLQILVDGANPVTVGLTPSSPNCSPNATVPGSYVCTAKINVATGARARSS
jgi:hypothetical protein